jgi:hypothetical protein
LTIHHSRFAKQLAIKASGIEGCIEMLIVVVVDARCSQ